MPRKHSDEFMEKVPDSSLPAHEIDESKHNPSNNTVTTDDGSDDHRIDSDDSQQSDKQTGNTSSKQGSSSGSGSTKPSSNSSNGSKNSSGDGNSKSNGNTDKPNGNNSKSSDGSSNSSSNGGSSSGANSTDKPSSETHVHNWKPITKRTAVEGETGYYADMFGRRLSPIDLKDNLSEYAIVYDTVRVNTEVCNKCGFSLYDMHFYDSYDGKDANGIYNLSISSKNRKDFNKHLESCDGNLGNSGSSPIIENVVSGEYYATWVRLGTTVYVDSVVGYECTECGESVKV